jgi:HSP20 family protein
MAPRSLARTDPYTTDVAGLRRNFDDLFNRMFSAPFFDRWSGANPTGFAWIPPVESYIDQNKFIVRLALPGVKPSDVNVQAHGNELTISGERKQEVTPADERTFQCEFAYGAFERVVPLPDGVQADKIEANFNNGVLEIAAPLSEKALPRKIEIRGETAGRKLAA